MMRNKLLAEFFGTFWLTFGGCGSAVLAAKFIATEGAAPINLGIGLAGVSLAFGLTVLTMAYAIGLEKTVQRGATPEI
jgi:aquaporin Z